MKSTNKANPGMNARKPSEIPWQGWKQILLRVKDQLNYDHIQVVSAGVAFYFFLAVFPAIAALVSIYGLVVEPAEVQNQMNTLTNILPGQARELLAGILERMAGKSSSTLGWSLALSVLLSLYSSKKGVAALLEGVNIAYDQIDERGFFRKQGMQLLFTLGAIVVGIICLALIAIYPALVEQLNLPSPWEDIISWGRWIILAVIIIFSLALIYKIPPYRSNPKFIWVSYGAIFSTLLWIAGSLLFSWYVQNFGSFGETYGSFAAVIVLMLWFFLTAFIILLGAELNSEMEHQTRIDSTIGPDKPIGQRGAYHADHVIGLEDEKST